MATEGTDIPYHCNICGKGHDLQFMYACYHGHYLCRKCYKLAYNIDKNKECPEVTCNSEYPKNGKTQSLRLMERSPMMFPNPKIFSENLMKQINSNISIASIYKPSLTSLGISSKKPVLCPHNGCNRSIAVSALNRHFQHEHIEVPCVVSTLDYRNRIPFTFTSLHGEVLSLCLSLIEFDEKVERGDGFYNKPGDNLSPRMSYYSRCSLSIPKPFFVVMAAKITGNDYGSIDDDDEEEFPDCGFSPVDRIILYVTSNVITKYYYTIALSTTDQNLRIKYYGPLLTMNEDCKQMYDDGKGLILSHHYVDGMSDYGLKPVCLDVIIHERGEDSYDSD